MKVDVLEAITVSMFLVVGSLLSVPLVDDAVFSVRLVERCSQFIDCVQYPVDVCKVRQRWLELVRICYVLRLVVCSFAVFP